MSVYVRDGAIWRKSSQPYVRDGAVWREVAAGYVFDGSTWHITYPEAPVTPSGLAGVKNGGNPTSQINYTWNDLNSGENREDFHDLRHSTASSTGPWTTVLGFSTRDDTAETLTGLSDGVTVFAQVRARNKRADSAWSASVGSTTQINVPATPTNLVITQLCGPSHKLDWDDNADNETKYNIFSRLLPASTSATPTSTLAANTETFTTSTLVASGDYRYRVRATNAGGFSQTAEVSSTAEEPVMIAPSALVVTSTGALAFRLNWTDNETGTCQGNWGIQRRHVSPSTTAWGTISSTVSPALTTFTDSAVPSTGTWGYRVRANGGGGSSPFSTEDQGTTPASPPIASNLSLFETSTGGSSRKGIVEFDVNAGTRSVKINVQIVSTAGLGGGFNLLENKDVTPGSTDNRSINATGGDGESLDFGVQPFPSTGVGGTPGTEVFSTGLLLDGSTA